MNRIVILLVLSFAFCVGEVVAASPQPHLKEVVLMVRTMVCSSCAVSVEKVLSKIDGVAQVKVDLRKDIAVVRYDEKRVTHQQMVEALATAGYQAYPVKR